jgi:ATP synthase protein I
MVWSLVKISVSIVALLLAPKLIQPLNWPFLLGSMALCMQVYWVALLWRGR